MDNGMNNGMNKGLIMKARMAAILALACILWTSPATAQIYKVVDAEGNITFTDQAPADGSPPMKLPELSIIATDVQQETPATEGDAEAAGTPAPVAPTPRELRRMYRDFHITRPLQEETFWGTANTVVVQWGSSTPLQADMQVRVFINGTAQAVTQEGMLALTLDRGTHTVYAQLLDARGKTVITTTTVTFFIKQHSIGMNAQSPVPHRKT
jgi:hypothetical protein